MHLIKELHTYTHSSTAIFQWQPSWANTRNEFYFIWKGRISKIQRSENSTGSPEPTQPHFPCVFYQG